MKKSKLISLLALATAAAGLASCGDNAKCKIGVLLPVEHAALRTCANGFKEALNEAGLVEGTDYSINFIFLFDTEDLSLIEVHNVSREELTDGIPWVAVDEENGYIYTSTWHETDELLRFNLDDFTPADSIKLSESVSRIQGGEFYNGTLYLSKDNSSSTNEDVLAVDITTGQVSVAFTQIMTNYDNEAEDMTVYPRADGSLFHVLNYDKLIGLNIMHY